MTVLQADITDSKALSNAADEVAKVTGGSLDILINNAAVVGTNNKWNNLPDFTSLSALDDELTEAFHVNVVGVAFTINTFLPLIRKGETKKVITLTTGLADDNLTNKYRVGTSSPYSISKGRCLFQTVR